MHGRPADGRGRPTLRFVAANLIAVMPLMPALAGGVVQDAVDELLDGPRPVSLIGHGAVERGRSARAWSEQHASGSDVPALHASGAIPRVPTAWLRPLLAKSPIAPVVSAVRAERTIRPRDEVRLVLGEQAQTSVRRPTALVEDRAYGTDIGELVSNEDGAMDGALQDRATQTRPATPRPRRGDAAPVQRPAGGSAQPSKPEPAPRAAQPTGKPADKPAASPAPRQPAATPPTAGRPPAGDQADRATMLVRDLPNDEAAESQPIDLTGISGSLKGDVVSSPVDAHRIVITGDEEDLDFIERLLALMEGSAPQAQIEIFTLEKAKATALKDLIEQVVRSRIEAMTSQPGPAERFSINAEARSNSLIVSATEQYMDIIRELIERLDVDTGPTDFKSIALDHVRASDAAAMLTPMLKRINDIRDVPTEVQPTIEADERTNSIIIIGTPADISEAERLIQTIDIAIPPTAPNKFVSSEAVIIGLTNAKAEDVAKVLNDMIKAEQDAAREGAASGGTGAAGGSRQASKLAVRRLKLTLSDGTELPELDLEKPIRIVPEKGTNSLIVYSTGDNNESLKAIVKVFDSLPLGEDTDVRAFALAHAEAKKIADLLKEVFEKGKEALKRPSEGTGAIEKGVLPPVPDELAARGLPYNVSISSDQRTNTVVVIGRKDAVLLAAGLVKELDKPSQELGVRAQVIKLKNGQATAMEKKLTDLLDKRATSLGADQNKARDSALVIPDDRSNSLIVLAADDIYDFVEKIVLELDGAENYRVVDIAFRKLNFADATKLAGMLQELFTKKKEADPSGDPKDTLSVFADTRSNSLVMTGSRAFLDEAEGLLTNLDKQFAPTVEFRIRPIKLSSAANIATLLKDMVEKALKQTDSKLQGTPIHIAADSVSQSLLMAASHEDMVMLERWVELLDQPSQIGSMYRIIPLARGSAEDISKTVDELFKARAGSGGSTGGGSQSDITVKFDATTNSVVAYGPPAMLDDIAAIVTQLSNTTPGSGAVVKLFKLEQASAEDAGELLTNILSGQGGSVGGTGTGGGRTGGGGGQNQDKSRQVMLIFQAMRPEVGMQTLKAMRDEVIVISDVRTNSLVITAPPDSMSLMESLVAAVDVPPDSAKIKVFTLRNSDAEKMVDTLEKLFQSGQGGSTTGRTTTGGGRQDQQERQLTLEGGPGGGRQDVSFTFDARTNSVIAAGTPGYLDLVEQVISNLDLRPIEDRKTFVYSPRNIVAEKLAESMKEFSDAEKGRVDELGDDISKIRKQDYEILAVHNEDANRIIFSVSPRVESQVMEVLRELDQPPPQVMIQVLILEVTMENTLELGVEFAFQDLQFQKAGPSDTTTFDYVGGTDIGAAGAGLGGFTFTITGADFNFLVRTLQSESKLNVLSRPQIVAMDNQEASISITNSVPYVTGTSTTIGGALQTQVSREDVGIELIVTPQINPDGFVRMEIEQNVSDLTDSTVPVGQGLTAPIFFERKAKTTVTVKDNETIVLGGLITSRDSRTEQKVPLLGDIPLLGNAFRFQNDETRRTELLVVLTPRVVRTVDDYRDLSVQERDITQTVPATVLESPLMQGLQLAPLHPLPGEIQRIDSGVGAPPAPVLGDPEERTDERESYGPMRPALHSPKGESKNESYNVPLVKRSG